MKIGKNKKLIFLLILLTIPTFWRMLRPGIYSMQDFHIFRLFEFDRCVKDLQLPCRWAPDAAFGYGEPLFNFYTQIPYVPGELFHILGFQIIDAIKIVFTLTLVGSGLSMYLLAYQIWQNKSAAILSSVLYVYAPYRAVDVWVRSALPEAMAFAIFPFTVYFANTFMAKKDKRSFIAFSISLALLILTHNLSFLMFSLFLVIWLSYKIIKERNYKTIPAFAAASILSLLLSSFYLLPAFFESKFINLGSTTQGYFDFRGHFTSLNQLLLSRFWGYGASLFGPDDDLSLSVGQAQWILPTLGLALLWFFKKKEAKTAAVFTAIAWFALFLTHNKSVPIWEETPFLAYLQFPWRWLAIAAFSFALAGGGIVLLFKRNKVVTAVLIAITILSNVTFFREDIWYKISDKEQFSGSRLEEQQASALSDYWPIFAKAVPTATAPKNALLDGSPIGEEQAKNTKSAWYKVTVEKESEVQFPIAYFPGWTAKVGDTAEKAYPSGNLGLITIKLPAGDNSVFLNFVNTPVRTIGNTISLLSIVLTGFLVFKKYEF